MPTKKQIAKESVFGAESRALIQAKLEVRNHYWRLLRSCGREAHEHRSTGEFTPRAGINVVAVGVGEKVTAGRCTGRLCVKIFVAKKFPKSRIRSADLIPRSVGRTRTDVVAVNYPVPRADIHRDRTRPAQPGTSVGPDFGAAGWVSAGTFGVVVTGRKNKKNYVLSNNHVLADENRIPIGTRIFQPGSLDDGSTSDRIARLSEFVPLKFNSTRNWMDAAIAELYTTVGVDKEILGIGTPRSASKAKRNTLVRKSGRTSGVTEGIVRETKVDVFDMEFEQGWVRMDDVISIEGVSGPFSDVGDSGSAIVNADGRVVGLLFGGSDARDFAIPIHRILRRFKVRIQP